MMKCSLFSVLLAASAVSAVPLSSNPSPALKTRQTGCEHTATSRGCWGDYSIDTDFLNVLPRTGITRGKFNFTPKNIEYY